jgi:hypothetical protein
MTPSSAIPRVSWPAISPILCPGGKCVTNLPFLSKSPHGNPLPAQVVASYTALLQLSAPGVWGIKVQTTASSLTTWVLINGLQVPLNAKTHIGLLLVNATGKGRSSLALPLSQAERCGEVPLFVSSSITLGSLMLPVAGTGINLGGRVTRLLGDPHTTAMPVTLRAQPSPCSAPGWFNFELRIAFPSNNVPYSLLFKPPSASTYSSYYGFVATAPPYVTPDYALNASSSSPSWQVSTPRPTSHVSCRPGSLAPQHLQLLTGPAQFNGIAIASPIPTLLAGQACAAPVAGLCTAG